MIYIDLDADLNMEDDEGRNFSRATPPTAAPAVGVLVAGRPDFWSWVVVDVVEDDVAYFHQVSTRHAASVASLVATCRELSELLVAALQCDRCRPIAWSEPALGGQSCPPISARRARARQSRWSRYAA